MIQYILIAWMMGDVMLDELLQELYESNLWMILIAMPVLIAVWSVIGARFSEKIRVLNTVIFALAVMMIIYVTVFSRGESEPGVDLMPLSSFERAKVNREIYRAMVMNILLFFPFGLSLPFLLKGSAGRRVLLTIAAACLLSVSVEIIQLIFRIGLTETDDVICNTFGAALGGLSYPLSQLWIRLSERRKKTI
ncbi:MAG: VanZ family protein [Ruminococcus sp.]|nr:VanZ family protein [Ruminococcus sp.]